MVQAKNRFASFEDYLALDPEELPEGFYEYVDGELVDRHDWGFLVHRAAQCRDSLSVA
jgi:hypothetical protein